MIIDGFDDQSVGEYAHLNPDKVDGSSAEESEDED